MEYKRPDRYISYYEGKVYMDIDYNKTPIKGKLQKTDRFVKPIRSSKRRLYIDNNKQLWVKIRGVYWRYPQEIEH